MKRTVRVESFAALSSCLTNSSMSFFIVAVVFRIRVLVASSTLTDRVTPRGLPLGSTPRPAVVLKAAGPRKKPPAPGWPGTGEVFMYSR